MLIDSGVTSAFLSCISRLTRCPGAAQLAQQRLMKIKKQAPFAFLRHGCDCEPSPTVFSLPRYFPLIEEQCADSNKGEDTLYKPLGFELIAWLIPGSYLPHIEMVELPLMLPNGGKAKEMVEWNAELQSTFTLLPISARFLRDRFGLPKNFLWRVRYQALQECFLASRDFGHVNFSVLEAPIEIQFGDETVDNYLNMNRNSIACAPFEKRGVRQVIERSSSRFYLFELQNFSITCGELRGKRIFNE